MSLVVRWNGIATVFYMEPEKDVYHWVAVVLVIDGIKYGSYVSIPVCMLGL
jgi:hypothetical protein